MPEPGYLQQIRKLVSEDRLSEALLLLRQLLDKGKELDIAILQTGRFAALETQIMSGTISEESSTLGQNKLRSNLLSLVNRLEERQSSDNSLKKVITATEAAYQKNVLNNSSINAGGDVHIGDEHIGRDKVVNNITQYSGNREIPKWLTNYPRFDEKLIGRTKDLVRLTKMLAESKNVVLVNGMGGIGKTTLAIAYLDKCKEQYDHIVWLEQLGDFPEAVLTNELLLSNLGVTAVSGEPEMDTQRILNQLGNISGNCLLVIDNADDRLQPYRAHLPRDWRVLITSREALGFSAAFDLDFLSETDAVALFYVHYDHQPDDALVLEIVKAVEFHTLTIELLAKTAARKKRTLPLDKLWQSIQQGGLQLGKVINVTIPHSHHENIEKIFPYLCSIFELQHLSEQENGVLKQFVCLPPTFHAFDELKNFLQIEQEESIEQLEDSLRLLKEKGWLLADQAADAYKIHRIVLDVVYTKLHIEAEHVAELLAQLIKLTDYHTGQNPVEQFPLIPYGKHLLTIIGNEYSKSTGRLYNNMAGLYQAQGRYEEALIYFQKAIEIFEAVLDAKHPSLANSYNNIGLLYKDQGRYEEALIYFQKAIEIREAVLDAKHPDLATYYNNIGLLYKGQGRYEESLTFYQKAIEIMEAVLDAKHPALATSYNNIGLLYKAQGRYEEALTFFQKAIEIREEVLDAKHPALATSYNNIGLLYQDQGRYEEALTFFQKAIEISEAVLDAKHPSLATYYNNIGLLYKAQGRYEEALTFFQKAIEIREEVLDAKHPSLATSYNNIGLLYKDQGRYEEALTFYQKAIEIREAVLDAKHPDLATSYNNIGLLYKDQGRYEEALTFFQKAIEISEAVLDAKHPSLATYYNNIGLLYKAQGRYEEALTFFQKAIEIKEEVLDAKHPSLAISYNNIGLLYKDQRRYEEALTFFQKAIEILEPSLGRGHPHTQTVMRNLEGLRTEIKEGK